MVAAVSGLWVATGEPVNLERMAPDAPEGFDYEMCGDQRRKVDIPE